MKKTLSLMAVLFVLTSACAQSNPSVVVPMNKALFVKQICDYENHPGEWSYLGDKPAIIDFYATWCGPCRQLSPILEELAKQYGKDIRVYKVDVDKEQELAALFGIRSIPTLLFIPMQGKPQLSEGLMPKEKLEQTIKTFLLNKRTE